LIINDLLILKKMDLSRMVFSSDND